MLEERVLFFDVELYGSIFLEKEKKKPRPRIMWLEFLKTDHEKKREKNNEIKFYFLMESKF